MPMPLIGITGRVEQSARPPNGALFAISPAYIEAVELGGGASVIVPPYLTEPELEAVFERLDGLLISGGGDVVPALYGEEAGPWLWGVDERRDRAELALAGWALAKELPILAICRGHQVLNVAAGGTLIQDISTQFPGALVHSTIAGTPRDSSGHPVILQAGSRLAGLFGVGEIEVNSFHHQAAGRVGAGLMVTARAPDGIVEGLEHPVHPFCVGVQWHPEVMVSHHPEMRRLFEAFVEAARNRSR